MRGSHVPSFAVSLCWRPSSLCASAHSSSSPWQRPGVCAHSRSVVSDQGPRIPPELSLGSTSRLVASSSSQRPAKALRTSALRLLRFPVLLWAGRDSKIWSRASPPRPSPSRWYADAAAQVAALTAPTRCRVASGKATASRRTAPSRPAAGGAVWHVKSQTHHIGKRWRQARVACDADGWSPGRSCRAACGIGA